MAYNTLIDSLIKTYFNTVFFNRWSADPLRTVTSSQGGREAIENMCRFSWLMNKCEDFVIQPSFKKIITELQIINLWSFFLNWNLFFLCIVEIMGNIFNVCKAASTNYVTLEGGGGKLKRYD